MPAPIKDVLFFAGSNWNGSTPDEIVEALDIAGYAIVPKQPTPEMIQAVTLDASEGAKDAYIAMLKAWTDASAHPAAEGQT
jgi:hypothetical protein